MTAWAIAALALTPPLLAAVLAAGRGPAAGRLVAAQMASTLAVLLAAVVATLSDQPSAIDVALALALLGLPATLVFALFEERWL